MKNFKYNKIIYLYIRKGIKLHFFFNNLSIESEYLGEKLLISIYLFIIFILIILNIISIIDLLYISLNNNNY